MINTDLGAFTKDQVKYLVSEGVLTWNDDDGIYRISGDKVWCGNLNKRLNIYSLFCWVVDHYRDRRNLNIMQAVDLMEKKKINIVKKGEKTLSTHSGDTSVKDF
jgi:hypothetical protein